MPKVKTSLPYRRPSPDMAPSLRPISDIVTAELDRLSDIYLQRGFHIAAERLAFQAAELRGVAQ